MKETFKKKIIKEEKKLKALLKMEIPKTGESRERREREGGE